MLPSFNRSLIMIAVLVVGTAPFSAFAQSKVKSADAAAATEIAAPAQVRPYETARIFAKASGFVSVVHVDIGETVKKGQLLAELSIPEMAQELLREQALVAQADAAVAQAEAKVAGSRAMVIASQSQVAASKAHLEKHRADIEFAESELTRITSLVASRAINEAMQDEKRQQLRAARAELVAAEADVQSAESNFLVTRAGEKLADADLVFAQSQRKVADATLAHTNALMDYAKIYAPFDGMITHRGIDTGDFVISAAASKTTSSSLFTLNRIGNFRIVFDVPESAAGQVKTGQQVELKVDSVRGQVFTGEVRRTAGELDTRTRTLRVEAEVCDEKSQLRPGMYGTLVVTFATDSTPARK